MPTKPKSVQPTENVGAEEEISLAEALKMLRQLQDKQAKIEAALLEKDQAIAATQQELEKTSKELAEATQSQEGWLITVPNSMYDGNTMGIKFSSGIAFLPKDGVYDHVRPPVVRQRNMSDADFDELKRRIAKLNTAEIAAHRLHDDFGYEIQFFTYAMLKDLKDVYKQRAVERAKAEESAKAAEEYLKNTMPARLSGKIGV